VYLNKRKPIKNLEEFEYYLEYPEMMERTDPTAEISDDGENEGGYEKGGFNSKLKSGHDISRYPSSRYSSYRQKPPVAPELEESLTGQALDNLNLAINKYLGVEIPDKVMLSKSPMTRYGTRASGGIVVDVDMAKTEHPAFIAGVIYHEYYHGVLNRKNVPTPDQERTVRFKTRMWAALQALKHKEDPEAVAAFKKVEKLSESKLTESLAVQAERELGMVEASGSYLHTDEHGYIDKKGRKIQIDETHHRYASEYFKKRNISIPKSVDELICKYMKLTGHVRYDSEAFDERIEVGFSFVGSITSLQLNTMGRLSRKADLILVEIRNDKGGIDKIIDKKQFISVRKRIQKYVVESKLNESLAARAERELKLAGLFSKDSDYEGMLGEAVLELMEVFANQGHSGSSAMLTADLFGRLAKFDVLTELTDNPDEWNDISEYSEGPMWQSKKKPSVFSEDGGQTYYDLDELAIEHIDEEGASYLTYGGEKVMHTSKAYTA